MKPQGYVTVEVTGGERKRLIEFLNGLRTLANDLQQKIDNG